LLLLILYFGDKTTFYLLGFIFIAISFVTNFLYNHPDKKIFNRVASILFIFFSPLFVAHFINNHGFKMISFVKKDISIKIDNREINSTLIYQTDSELYLHDINKSFVIKKGDINGYIIFKEYKYQSKPLLDINETKSFIKNIF
jgi:cytochrome c biogenesis protein CcdA